ncbi:MAG: hypothetical protein KDA61_11305, partial [Planctomycetales bacterium]|nr:hypothetical protein [Planctomycetales bacterium]
HGQGSAVIGGYVYRGSIAAFQGHYFFADAGSLNIWKLDPDAVDPAASVTRVNNQLVADVGAVGSLSSFAEDASGELYMIELFSGELFRFATDSQDAVWNGSEAIGTPGDGANWNNAANWTRGNTADLAFVAQDRLIFAAGPNSPTLAIPSLTVASAVAFESDQRLSGGVLQLLSGNVTVAPDVVASLDGVDLQAESAAHSLRKLGEGTLVINGTAGQVAVKEGTVAGEGTLAYASVRSGAVLAPGDGVGAMVVQNALALETDSTLRFELGGALSGEFDTLQVGSATLAGILEVSLVDLGGGTYEPRAGDTFALLTSNSTLTGSFDALHLPTLDPALDWSLQTDGGVVTLSVLGLLGADFNSDGRVDENDLNVWASNFGLAAGAGRALGDADADGDVDGEDFLAWQRLQGADSGQASAGTIPEPTSVWLALVGGLFVARRSRQSSSGLCPE